MNLYSLIAYAFRRTFNKPIDYLTYRLMRYLNNHQMMRKKFIELGKVVIDNEEKNIIAKSERKQYRKAYHSNQKLLEKGAESSIEFFLITLLGIIPVYLYFKKMF